MVALAALLTLFPAQIRDLNMPLLDAMSGDQREVFYKVANQAVCPCNCPLTLAGCLRDKPKCRRAQILAKFIGREVQSGLTTMDIVTHLAEGFPSTAAAFKFSKSPAYAIKGKGKVQIVEFADFRCHHCKEAVKVMQDVAAALGDKVEINFRHFPIQSQDPSVLAAEAAEAAGAQGKFWPMHDMMFKNQDALGREELLKFAKELKLDVARFQKELDEHKYKAKVMADKEEGNKAGVEGTPAIFVNGREMRGMERTPENFRDRVDFELSQQLECE